MKRQPNITLDIHDKHVIETIVAGLKSTLVKYPSGVAAECASTNPQQQSILQRRRAFTAGRQRDRPDQLRPTTDGFARSVAAEALPATVRGREGPLADNAKSKARRPHITKLLCLPLASEFIRPLRVSLGCLCKLPWQRRYLPGHAVGARRPL